jgi:serine protease Do
MPAVVNISTTQKAERQTQRPRQFPPMPGPGQGPGQPNPFGGDPFEEFFRRFGPDPYPPPSGEQRSLGSGFIISQDGYIVTNNHVIGEADTITVRLSDDEEYEAKKIGSDEKTDLALIKIETKQPLPFVPFGQSSILEVGNWVMAIGNPFGLSQTVTVGIVSAKGRVIGAGPYDDFIQTDASINPGNSGGPLLNLQGEVVGVNSAIFSRSGGNIGIGFAIPIDQAKSIVDQLKEKGSVTRGWLGVMIQSVTPELAKSFDLPEPKGALVAEVTPDSPAAKAGLERGDIITSFKGTEIGDSRDLPSLVAQTPVGDPSAVKVLRGGTQQTFTVTLGELDDQQQAKAESGEASEKNWGMSVSALTPEIRQELQLKDGQKGIVVTEVEPDSPAHQAGLLRGDILEEVNRKAIESIQDFTTAISEIKEKESLLLLVRRNNFTSFFALRKEE